MAAAFNEVDKGRNILIRRNNRYYTITPVQIESVTELEPNDVTKAAIIEAKSLSEAPNSKDAIDLSSVESMLESFGI